jgi:Na+-driven multidrug efflux pump
VAGLRPVALAQPFWAILIVQSGSLRGTGDTRYPLRVNTSGIWAAVILGAIFVQTIGGGLAAIWSAFLITAPFTAYLMWRRFQQTISQKELAVSI